MIVHNILTQQNNIDKQNNQIFNPLIKMHYQYDIPIKYTDNAKERIKSRSFYSDTRRISEHKNIITKNRTYCKFKQKEQTSNSQPKIVQLGFGSFSKPKQKKQNQKAISTHEYYSLMVDSMQAYIQKVEKGKKKKLQRCEKIKSFGVNIQAIRAKPEQQRLNQAYQKIIRSPTRRTKKSNQLSSKQISLKNNENRLNQISVQNFMKTISTTHYAQSKTKKNNHFSKKLMFKPEKKQDDNKISSKLVRMFKHFSIILASYAVYLNRQNQKSTSDNIQVKNKKTQKKYTYYVGPGNNKNLIVSILKKRWWWVEAQDISTANLVWTQLKISNILQKQTSMTYSQLQIVDPELYKKDYNISLLQTQQQSYQSQKIYNIFHKDHSTVFHNKLSSRDEKKYLRSMNVPNVVHNHYQANYMLGNKKALYYNMTEYKKYKNQNCFQYMPLTFHIQKVNSKAWKQFQKKVKQDNKSLWIIKPGENSNRGQGIFVSDSIQKIKSKIEKNKKHTYIIQKYIKNNLTFQRRKFDIRTYVLMVSIGGVQKFYWYTEGYLRTASQIYDLSDLDDPFIHLTNDAIQANGQNYGKFQKGNKITYSQFQRYVDITYPNQKYSVPALIQRMKNIAKQIVEATYFKIDPCQKQYSFQLFGLDFLVDTNFKPWLLEVNTNPCLELSSPVLQRLIPRMIQNLFRIVIDPVFQPFQNDFPRNLACYIPQNIIENNRFQLIFDYLHNRNLQWQQYSINLNSNKVYQDENQQFQNDGEIIKIED